MCSCALAASVNVTMTKQQLIFGAPLLRLTGISILPPQIWAKVYHWPGLRLNLRSYFKSDVTIPRRVEASNAEDRISNFLDYTGNSFSCLDTPAVHCRKALR